MEDDSTPVGANLAKRQTRLMIQIMNKYPRNLW